MARAFQRANEAMKDADEAFETVNEIFDRAQTNCSESVKPSQTIRFTAHGFKNRLDLILFFLKQACRITFKGRTEFKFKAK